MTWHIVLRDKEGQKYTSSALDTREQAYSFACDLLRMGNLEILSIENRQGETIDLDEVALWSEAARLGRSSRSRA